MTKSYTELKKESTKFVEFLNKAGIIAYVDEISFRDYNVQIKNILGATAILYHKPSKSSFSIGTHNISDSALKIQVEELWHQYQCPDVQNIQGLCAYVDGSFYNNKIGWGLVVVQDNQILTEDGGVVNLSPEEGSRQIAGEVQGVLEALSYAERNNISSITIFYDYVGLQKWACGEWKANSSIAQYYSAKMMQNRIRITWKKVKAHTGNRFNELADQLAKKYLA